jgi:hypothetical protein
MTQRWNRDAKGLRRASRDERTPREHDRADQADVDTVPLEALRDDLLEPTTEIAASGGDPYRTAKSSSGHLRAQRRTLDDMRRLSEEIKRARAASRKPTK